MNPGDSKQMMIDQGYIPKTCTLNDQLAGPLIYVETLAGRRACDRCNMDRDICKGRPKREWKPAKR